MNCVGGPVDADWLLLRMLIEIADRKVPTNTYDRMGAWMRGVARRLNVSFGCVAQAYEYLVFGWPMDDPDEMNAYDQLNLLF